MIRIQPLERVGRAAILAGSFLGGKKFTTRPWQTDRCFVSSKILFWVEIWHIVLFLAKFDTD